MKTALIIVSAIDNINNQYGAGLEPNPPEIAETMTMTIKTVRRKKR